MDQLEAQDVAILKAIAKKNGWFLSEKKREQNKYAVTIARIPGHLSGNRNINSLESARSFGYPECCFNSFCELFGENYKKKANKQAILEKLIAPKKKWYLLNDFLYSWFWGYSLSFHHPCEYGCKESVRTNMKILLAVKKESPTYAHEIIKHLKMPMLVWFDKTDTGTSNYYWFRNRTTLIFDGSLIGAQIHYSDVARLSTVFQGAQNPIHLKIEPFKMGNICELRDNELLIFRNSKHLFSLVRNKEHEGIPLIFS